MADVALIHHRMRLGSGATFTISLPDALVGRCLDPQVATRRIEFVYGTPIISTSNEGLILGSLLAIQSSSTFLEFITLSIHLFSQAKNLINFTYHI
jgi:hypothetical protein